MRKSNEQSLGEIIKQFIQAYKMEDKITEVRIIAAWEKVMGPQIHSLTDRIAFREQVMTVFLRSAPLREELSMARTKIIDLINKEVKQKAIKELHFR
jgi:predicted nucleic acid-binding Zn ribbon protein